MKAANLGDLGVNHEPTVTYEGDNNVLVQQTSNWILRQWNDVQAGSTIGSPLSSVTFLLRGPSILKNTFEATSASDVMSLDCESNFSLCKNSYGDSWKMSNSVNNRFMLMIPVVRRTYEWLITWLVLETQKKFDEAVSKGLDHFAARSKAQVYRAAHLSRAYGEVFHFHSLY